jgi:hypothetical protein
MKHCLGHHYWQNSPFWAIAFLRRFCQIGLFLAIHFFGFRNNFFTEQGRQPCAQPPNMKIMFPYLCPPVTGWPSYTPRHRTHFILPFTTHMVTVEVFWILFRYSYSCNRPWRPISLWDVEAPTFSRQSPHRWRWGCQPYSPGVLYSWYWLLLQAESTAGP